MTAARPGDHRVLFPTPVEIATEFFTRSWPLNDAQRAWLRKRGLSTEAMAVDPPLCTSGPLRFGHVVFGEQYFDFADPDAEGAVPVFVVIARAWDGVTDDVVAFDAQGRFSTLLGRANLLGEHLVLAPRLCQPLMVFSDVWSWLRADRDGLLIIDWDAAARLLAGHALAVDIDSVGFGHTLHSRLSRPAPPIFVRV